MNDLEREVIQMQIDNIDEMLKHDREITTYDFDIKSNDDKETVFSAEAKQRLRLQNQLCIKHFRMLGELRKRLSILLQARFEKKV